MKRLVILGLVACGGGDFQQPEQVNLGTLEQPIYMPAGYGREGDGSRCQGEWADSICKVPDWGDREFKIRLDLDTCDAFTADRIREAVGLSQIWMAEYGWDVNIVRSGQNGNIRCDMNSYGPPGSSSAKAPFDVHITEFGILSQYGGFTITLRPLAYYTCGNGDPWTYATLDEKINVAINVALHELFHVAGLGHNGQPGTLMNSSFACSNSAPQWQGLLEPLADEVAMLRCYNPNSGPNPWCG